MMPYTLYVEKLPDDNNLTRHEKELIAVEKLVKRAFGPDARKYNLPSGAPAIEDCDIPFSISHCRTHAALAVGNGCNAIGVDIETYRNTLRRVVHKYLTDAEQQIYTTDIQLLQAWTLKEAAYKAAHTPGLALDEIHLPADARQGDMIVARHKSYIIAATHSTTDYFISIVITH